MMPLWDVLERFNYMDLVGVDVIEKQKNECQDGLQRKLHFAVFVSDN